MLSGELTHPRSLVRTDPHWRSPLSPHALTAPAVPASLDLPQLAELTRRYADEVRAGLHRVVVDPEQRWYNLLRSDDTVDVWLITWSTEQFAELHDHGDSLGALTVVRGSLTEDRWVPGRHALTGRRLPAGSSAAFGRGYVHEVSNPEAQAAVSVHAYSPPLTRMSYYALDARSDGAGSVLRRARTAVTAPGSSEGVG